MTGWSIRRTVDPAVPLLSTAEAKQHLRVDTADEDALVDAYVAAATGVVEEWLSRQLVTATWELTLDSWPWSDTILLPRPPVQSVTSITYVRDDGSVGTVDPADYLVVASDGPGRVVLDGSWPTDRLQPAAAVKVTYQAGYGDPADVPEPIRTAVRILTGTLFEHRESVVVGTITAQLPLSAAFLLSPYRVWWF